VRLRIKPLLPVTQFVLRGFRPEWAPSANVSIAVDGAIVAQAPIHGEFEVVAALPRPAQEPLQLEIVCDSEPGWAAARGDDRDLAFLLTELRARHPGLPA
jgi:hypothetical protein